MTRRQFLLGSAGVVGVGAAAALFRSSGALQASTARDVFEDVTRPTLCTLCPSGCGLAVRVADGRAVKAEGNALHPVNQGVCCPKGQAALEALYSPERLRTPLVRDWRDPLAWRQATWDEALARVADRLGALRGQGLAHTVAFLQGDSRGQLRALARRLMAAYGSPNVIDATDADVQAARLAMFLMQGVNGVPVYDWSETRYVLAFGGSFLETGQNVLPALSGAGFLRRSTTQRGRYIVIDPRLSVSAAKADEWVPIRPGTYGALALGIAYVLIQSKLYDEAFVSRWTFGFDDFQDETGATHRGFKSLVLSEYTLDRVEAMTGVPAGTIARLAGEFAASRPAVALLSAGRGALTSGNALSTAMAVYALNALVGNIDAPGGVMVQRYPKLADWPALALDAAAHKGQAAIRVDGAGTNEYPVALSGYNVLPEHIASKQPYPVNAVVMLGANPVFDAANGKRFADALDAVPFVVSLAPLLDESVAHADVVLPLATAFESWGDAYVEGTGFAGISLAQPVVAPVGEARGAGDALLLLAKALGGPVAAAFPWADYQTLLKARLAGSDISFDKLQKDGAWSEMIYSHATPGSAVWRNEIVGRTDRVNAPRDGRFDFYARELSSALRAAGETPADRDCLPHFTRPETDGSADLPLVLVLHETMTQPRGWQGVLPSLQEVYGLQADLGWTSWVELNPATAAALGISNDDLVWVESAAGKVQARARLFAGLWPNAVAMPLGQGHGTHVAWGRNMTPGAVGVNPLALADGKSERWTALAAQNSIRVKVYKA